MSEQGMRDPWEREFNVGTGLIEPPWSRLAHDGARVLVRADWLDLPPEALADLLALIGETPHLTWCLFSERPRVWADRLRAAHSLMAREFASYADSEVAMLGHWLRDLAPTPPPNVYVGTTVTTQAEADERIPELLSIPARVRVLRCTPRERIHLGLRSALEAGPDPHLIRDEIGWVVCEGGDSPMHPEWVRSLRDQCEEAGVPFWFSGWGEWVSIYDRDIEDPDWRRVPSLGSSRRQVLNLAGGQGFHGERVQVVERVGKDKAGRLLDGRTWDGVPS